MGSIAVTCNERADLELGGDAVFVDVGADENIGLGEPWPSRDGGPHTTVRSTLPVEKSETGVASQVAKGLDSHALKSYHAVISIFHADPFI